MVFPVVGETLVEVGVLLFSNFFGLFHPDWLVLVQLFEFGGDFLDFLLLFVLFFFVLLNLNVFFLFILFFVVLVVGDLFFGGLLDLEIDGERDELGVLFDKILEFSLF